MAVCLRYMGNREDAEDVLQEGFVTLFTKLESYNGSGSFEGWARKVFVNTALMHLRKNDVLGVSDDIEECISEIEENLDVINIERVVKKDFQIETLGCTEATSRSKLQRARLQLQEMISKRK